MKTKLLNHLFFLWVAIAFVACREKSLEIQIQMLPGKYCFNEGNNNDSLYIYDDRNYTHKFVLSKSEVFESKGKWEYDSVDMEMSFYDFIFYNEMGPANKTGGIWHSKVYLTREGEFRLIYSRENDVFYYKKLNMPKLVLRDDF